MKRLIPKIILTAGIVTTLVSGTIMVKTGAPINNNIKKLNGEKTKIYEQYMQSDDFKARLNQDLQEVSNAYADGIIDYETFESKVKYLSSIDNAKSVLASSNNELKNEISSLDEQLSEVKDEKSNNKMRKTSYNIAIGGLVTSGAGFMACMWPEKDEDEDKFGYRI